jgi:DNA-nicking Smr family endonuclease
VSTAPGKAKPQKIASLADLQRVKADIEAQAQRAAALAAQQAQEAKQRAAQHNLFQAAVGAVKPLQEKRRAQLAPTPPLPIPKQQQRDEAAALTESLSDEVDISSLLDTDDHLSFRRPGVGPDVAQKLRKGKWSIQKQIDLHGLRSDEAREVLGQFIRDAHKQGLRCVRVVHGKGLGSPGKTPVLKEKVHRWLVQKSEVVAFVQAPPAQGGAGALVVLLQPLRLA